MAKKVVELPKYGFFGNNKDDRRQIRDMKKAGYEIMDETFGTRIWIEK